MTKAIEAAARKVALENDDYDGPVLNWEGYVEDAGVAITAYLAAMEADIVEAVAQTLCAIWKKVKARARLAIRLLQGSAP